MMVIFKNSILVLDLVLILVLITKEETEVMVDGQTIGHGANCMITT